MPKLLFGILSKYKNLRRKNMKRLISLLLVCLMVVPFGALTAIDVSAAVTTHPAGTTLYANPTGGDAAKDGLSPENAIKSVTTAYQMLPDGGTIYIIGTASTGNSYYTEKPHSGKITIKGYNNESKFTISSRFILNGDTEFTDITLETTKDTGFIPGCHDLTITETVTTTTACAVINHIRGTSNPTATTYGSNVITLNGGQWTEVILGHRNGLLDQSFKGVHNVLNVGGNAEIQKIVGTSRTINGGTQNPVTVEDSSVTVNLLGGKVTTWIANTDAKTTSVGRDGGLNVYIGKDFNIAESFTTSPGTGIHKGISGNSVFTAYSWSVGASKLVLAYEKYDEYKDSTLFRGFSSIEKELTSVSGYSITLDDGVNLNFFVKLDESIVNDSDAKMQFTVGNDAPFTVAIPTAAEVNGYKFTCHVDANQMTDTITAKIINVDGIVGTYTYSVARYAEKIINGEENYTENDITLVKALLNYGATAQNKFNHNKDDLANKNLAAAEQSAYETVKAEDIATVKNTGEKIAGVKYDGSTAVWNAKTHIRHYFEVTDNATTFTLNGEAVTLVEDTDRNVKYIEITDILPQEMDKEFTLVITNSTGTRTITYSVYSYFRDILSGNKYSAEMKAAVQAAYLYGQAANEYVK